MERGALSMCKPMPKEKIEKRITAVIFVVWGGGVVFGGGGVVGPGAWGGGVRVEKKAASEELSVTTAKSVEGPVITFTDDDTHHWSHSDALVVTLDIGGFMVRRILVDNARAILIFCFLAP